MSIRQAQRGAVHVMFLITVLVITLAFAALWFVQLQDNEKLKSDAAAARAALIPVQNEFEFAKKYYAEVAKVVGGGVPAEMIIPEGVARGEAILASDDKVLGNTLKKYMNEVREACRVAGDPASAPKNAREALDVVVNRYNAQVTEVTVRDQQINALKADVEARKAEVAAANKRRDDDLAAANTEKDNAVARLTQQLNDATAERDALQTKNRTNEEEIQKTREKANTDVVAAGLKVKEADSIVAAMKSNERIERETMKSDGKILAVNAAMKTLWIDAGAKHMLRRGTVFKVYETVKGGVKTYKGRIVVTSVEADRAEARIESEEGKISEGDWIFNPYFERGKTMRFVFLGALNGTLSKELATSMLEKNGAKVDAAITTATDFLVVGAKETPEAEELTENAAYKQAQQWGVEMIRAADLESFLKP
jgi:hypothetical protein